MPWSVRPTSAAALFARRLPALLTLAVFLLMPAILPGQTSPSPEKAEQNVDAHRDPNPDAKAIEATDVRPKSPAELKEGAWVILSNAVTDKHPDDRIQGLAALALFGDNPRSLKLIEDAMQDKDIDVRIAAVVAAGQTKSPAITMNLRRMLDDKEPPVAFAAALALWKLNDRSGEDIVMAVADGERTAASSAFNSATHTVNRDLHRPGMLARFGAMQGAGMLLGPFGMGLSAFEYLHKNGGDAARVSAIEALAQERTGPIRLELVAALGDKDPGVRAAACKALSGYHETTVSAAIGKVFDDTKPPVRYTAAASYLLSTGVAQTPPAATLRTKRSSHTKKM